jgi:hypothetical protein
MTYEPTNNFYVQKIYLTNIRQWRYDFFADLCKDKKVMHIGCADAMAFKSDSNLHIYLANKNECKQLDGLDIDIETTAKLKDICPGHYYTTYDQVKDKYDLILIPEVMEHVPDVHSFLKDVFSISSKEYFFTVPSMSVAEIFCDDTYCLEMIHPDHKYWFSPYTLFNVMKPFLEGHDMQMYYLESKSQIGIRLWKTR